jgi:hypothetical protein
MALQHEGEEIFLFVCWDPVLGDMTDCTCAIIKEIAFNVPPCAHFHFPIPGRLIVGEDLDEGLLP